MGHSRWRLQTALNYVAQKVTELGRHADVEILVADWGSEVPLAEVLELSPEAARITSFVVIPRSTAEALQKDSPFAEVFALNAAARRARGKYIGRIDQDTLVGKRFLQVFFELANAGKIDMGFANLKMVHYRFAVTCPELPLVDLFIRCFGRHIATENARSRSEFYFAGVGIWLCHRDVWQECGGYDERMIYMNAMETNMIRRLLPKYEMVDLGKSSNYDFYHLEHYHPWSERKSSTHRKVNPHLPFSQPDTINPNGEDWGLSKYSLEILQAKTSPAQVAKRQPLARFMALMLRVGPVILLDWIGLAFRQQLKAWKHRAKLLSDTVKGQPMLRWPGLVKRLLVERVRTYPQITQKQ